MVQQPDLPSPPEGLSRRSSAIWGAILTDYELDTAQQALFEEALRSLDRADQSRAIVEAEGPIVFDRFVQPRAHPAVAIERDARQAFVRTLRELGLDPG